MLLPIGAIADHIDVIEFTLNESCTMSKYLAIKDDFNEQWGAKNGYRSEVLVPIQSNNLTSLFWVGRSDNAATYGKAWDCILYTSPSPRDISGSRMPSSA